MQSAGWTICTFLKIPVLWDEASIYNMVLTSKSELSNKSDSMVGILDYKNFQPCFSLQLGIFSEL